jgi:hypothetical protein
MRESSFILAFCGVSAADENKYARDLAATLRNLDPALNAEQRRDREDTQDFGTTVAIVLGTASVTAVAKGVSAWLARNSGARLQISADGNVIATNLDSRDAAKIAQAFARGK